jgi:hypothetical protein
MFSLYYRIWVDCMKRARLQPENRETWEAGSMIFMSVAMAFNFVLIMFILQKYILGYFFYEINIDFLPKYVSNVISYVVLFVVPCVLVNYFLIFYKNRYKKLLKKYPSHNGKLFLTYFITSLSVPVILMWIGIIFFW